MIPEIYFENQIIRNWNLLSSPKRHVPCISEVGHSVHFVKCLINSSLFLSKDITCNFKDKP